MRISRLPLPLAASLVLALPPLLGPGAAAQPFRLDEIVVSPNRTPSAAARTGASVATLDRAALARGGGQTIGEALARLPGFHFHQTGGPGQPAGFALRGLPQRYVRVLVDGIDISEPSAPQPFAALSGLPARGFDRLELLAGSQSALWGGQAVGGVISLETAPPERDGLSGEIRSEAGSYGTAGGTLGLGLAGPRGDLNAVLDAVTTDGFSAAEGGDEDDGYRRRRLSFAGNLYPAGPLRLFASGFAGDEDGGYDAAFPPPDFVVADSGDRFETLSRGLRAGAELGLGGTTQTFAASWFEVTRDFFDPGGAPDFGSEGERLAFDYLAEAELAGGIGLVGGIDHRRERAVFDGAAERARLSGGFLQGSWTRGGLALSAALRRDDHSEFGGYSTGRLTASYAFGTGTVLRAALGTGFRAPSLDELFGPFGANPDLEPETSLSYDLGIEQILAGGRVRAGATLFRIEVEDLITYDSTCPVTPFGCYDQVTAGTSVSQGLALTGEWAVTEAIGLSGSYTYTDAEQALPGGGTTRRARVPRHDLALAIDADIGERLGFGVEFRRVANVVEGGAPLDDYTLVGARARYALNETAEITLRAENLLDADYQTALGYGTAGRSAYLGVAARF